VTLPGGEHPARGAATIVAGGEHPARRAATIVAGGEHPARRAATIVAGGEHPARGAATIVAGGARPARLAAALLAALAAASLSAGCKKSTAQGKRLASGLARDVTVSRGGALVSFIQRASHPDDRGVPDDLLLGDLVVAKGSGESSAQDAGAAVPTLAGARAFSQGGEWLAFLARWRFRAGEGELWLADASAAPRKVADGVSAMSWAPSGTLLAFVAQGRLEVVDASKNEPVPSVGVDSVQTFAWAPGGERIAARAPGASGGRVVLVDVAGGRVREVAKTSSDFTFAPDGALYVLGPPAAKGGDRTVTAVESFDARPREIGRATSLAASRQYVALLSTDRQPGEAFGALSRVARSGGALEPLGDRVSEFRFEPRGELLFLGRFDARARAGALTIATPGQPAREVAQRVQSFSVQGDRVLYIAQAPQKGDFKIELWTAPLDGSAPPRKLDDGVYGYQLTPGSNRLFWKARCAGGARSCSLFRGPADASSAGELMATNVAGFDLSEDGRRVLVQQPHRGASRAVDLAVLDAAGRPPPEGSVKPFALEADPSSRFVDGGGRRVVYASMGSAGEAGVYLVEVP
jgi:hypothetical protein